MVQSESTQTIRISSLVLFYSYTEIALLVCTNEAMIRSSSAEFIIFFVTINVQESMKSVDHNFQQPSKTVFLYFRDHFLCWINGAKCLDRCFTTTAHGNFLVILWRISRCKWDCDNCRLEYMWRFSMQQTLLKRGKNQF